MAQALDSDKKSRIERERWQIAGSAAEIYERYLVPAVFAPWAPLLVTLAELKPGERVLDLACGTGVAARTAAQTVGKDGKVIGLDLNPAMLAVARSIPTLDAQIDWREGEAVALSFPDSSFDLVLCQLGLQYFTDREAALREMHRVLVPRGRAAIMVWRPIQHSPGFRVLAKALEKHISADAAKIMQAPFSLGSAKELHSLIEGAGFHSVLIRLSIGTVRFYSPEDFIRYYAAGSPLAGHVAKADDDSRRDMIEEVASELSTYLDDEGLVFPIEANLAIARK